MSLEDYRSDMETCCRCSACKFIPLEKVRNHQPVNICPAIARYKFHAYSGGGRMGIGVAMLKGRLDYSEKLREVAFNCMTFGGEVGGTDLFNLMAEYINITARAKGDLIERGLVYNDDTSPFTQSFEHGHYGHGELLIRYAPNPATFRALTGEFMAQANDTAINGHFGVPAHVFGDSSHDLYGPNATGYHRWLRQIKKTFDPNNASEGSYYITDK